MNSPVQCAIGVMISDRHVRLGVALAGRSTYSRRSLKFIRRHVLTADELRYRCYR